MTDPRFSRLMELVEAAAARAPEDGDALLVRECADDTELLHDARELTEIARADAGAGLTGDLQRGVQSMAGAMAAEAGPPQRIGPFQVLGKLGEGGMGAVYLARQEAPIRRDVALKVVRAGFADGHLLARFEAERQALASLEHPGIARVFDAGATATGILWLAMEYVRGEPITAYCDRHALTVNDRLSLFVQVCRAIQHAHFNGVIHRDIKPGNVLVATVDGQPVVKVIDFGIAKLVSGLSDDADGRTRLGTMMGTLEYMSPEQAQGAATIDTRTDVYSLGVLLYELVSGCLPFDTVTLRALSPPELRALLVGTDPPPPGVRLAECADATELAACRSSDPRTLRRRLQGDLAWVTMKALERDPEHRYASALELAAEAERMLHHEPVLAAAPTLLSRLAKFYRRHRLPVTAAVLVFLAVGAGAAASTIGFLRAAEARRVAEHEAAVATRTSRFLTESLAAARPTEVQGGETTVREILDLAAMRLEQEADLMPEVEARLRFVLGASYASLAVYDQALDQLRRAQQRLALAGGASTVQATQALTTLSDVLRRRGQHFIAQLVNAQLLGLQEQAHGVHSVEFVAALIRAGRTFVALGDNAEAEANLRRARALRRQLAVPAGEDPLARPLEQLAAAIADAEGAPPSAAPPPGAPPPLELLRALVPSPGDADTP